MPMPRRAFTLIELLIVVAIIAILAAIAVPNFLEAQVRAKVSRAKSDLRTLATTFEAYAVDENAYPLNLPSPADTFRTPPADGSVYYRWFDYWIIYDGRPGMRNLTTPVAYIASLPENDPFMVYGEGDLKECGFYYVNIQGAYRAKVDGRAIEPIRSWDPTEWAKDLTAPENVKLINENDGARPTNWLMWSAGPDREVHSPLFALGEDYDYVRYYREGALQAPYDPTNGTTSKGNLYRLSGGAVE